MTKLGLLAVALLVFAALAMAQSTISSLSNSGNIVLAQAQPMQGQMTNGPDANYEAPDTMPTYQKNDGTDKD